MAQTEYRKNHAAACHSETGGLQERETEHSGGGFRITFYRGRQVQTAWLDKRFNELREPDAIRKGPAREVRRAGYLVHAILVKSSSLRLHSKRHRFSSSG